jgi:recombinational DNA repair protein (RecF pathway)
MLFATARSVREEKSKQRFALQDFSRIRVSLVKGKSGWRIGSAEALGNTFLGATSRQERGLLHFVFAQLRRYVHGEVAVPSVYTDVEDIFERVTEFVPKSALVQKLFSLRLLAQLGYVAPESLWSEPVETLSIMDALLCYNDSMAAAIARAIEKGAQESHL